MVEYQKNTSAVVGPLGSVNIQPRIWPREVASSEVLRGQKLGGGHEVSERGMEVEDWMIATPAHPAQSAQ